MPDHLSALPRRVAALMLLAMLQTGCTTKMNQATDPYQEGNFEIAAEQADKVAETKVVDGHVDGLVGPYERDRLWAGLEKAKILQEKGDFFSSLAIYTWVNHLATDQRMIDSWYAENPLNIDAWDAGKFMQQAGQAVLGADQTDYVLQPYELIMMNTYMTLNAIMCGQKAGAYAQSTLQLQEWEKKDLKLAGEEVVQPDLEKFEQKVNATGSKDLPAGFSIQKVFEETGFGKAKSELKQAVDAARSTRSADPRVAAGYLTEWLAYVQQGSPSKAAAVRKELASACGAKALLQQLPKYESAASPDFVVVFVGAGKAPARDYFSVRVPIPVGKSLGYFRGVYPFLRFRTDGRPREIGVTSNGRRVTTEPLDSIDAIAARNFQRRELELWLIPTIRGVIRVAISLAGQEALKGKDGKDNTWTLLFKLGNIATAEAEQADLRIWSTLPAEHHAVLVPRPKDGKLKIDVSDGVNRSEVEAEVGPGSSVVYLRAISGNLHSKAFVGNLRGGGDGPAKLAPSAPVLEVAPPPAESSPDTTAVASAAPRTATPSPGPRPQSPAAPPVPAPRKMAATAPAPSEPPAPVEPETAPPPQAPIAPEPPLVTEQPTPAGSLTITDLTAGLGPAAVEGERVSYHYACSIEGGGQVFDSRQGRGGPRNRKAGAGTAAPVGLTQALVGAREGMHRRVRVPSDLGYGSAGFAAARIPPNATLIFDIWIDHIGER